MGSVKNLLFWKKVTAVIGLFAIINSMIVSVPLAQAQTPPIASVTAEDHDTTFVGLDGNDFFVSWAASAQPAGFSQNRVYIVPNAVALTAENVDTNGCTSACTAKGSFDNWTFSVFNLPPFHSADSAGTAWNAATSYKACVVTTATANSITCSLPFSVTSDSVTDVSAPFIDFFPVHTMVNNGSNDVVFYAAIDDETPASAFTNTGDGGSEYFKLKYFSGGNWSSSINAVQVNGNLFKFTLPFASIPAVSSTLRYYLIANDANNNSEVICADYASFTEVACQSNYFIANVVSGASTVTVAGTVQDFSGANVESASVFPGGLAAPLTLATTASDGTYNIIGVPVSNMYDIAAFKSGYCESFRTEMIGTSNKTGVDMFINNNECFNDTSQTSGGSDRPYVYETIPWQGQFNVSPQAVLMMVMSSDLDATTVNDTNPTGANDAVYLTTDDGTTKIAGNVLYCADSSAQGCSSYLSATQSNVIVFDPTANLSAGEYTLVVTPRVLSSSGRNVDGNRDGGGHDLNFSVGGGTFTAGDMSTNYGHSGAYQPPYVTGVVPQGFTAPTNTKIAVEFSESMDSDTVTASSVQLLNSNNTAVEVTRTLSTDGERLIITPSAALSQGEYRLVVKGSLANGNGITMRDQANVANTAFETFIMIGSLSDSVSPTVYPYVTNDGTIAVNEAIKFGFNEAMDPDTLTAQSGGIQVKRGNINISTSILYEPSNYELTIQPNDVLPPNTAVTVSFINPIVKDFAGNAIAAGTIFNYTTGAMDTAAPTVDDGESGCDDYQCRVSFTEQMENDGPTGSNYNNSVLKPGNFALVVGGDTVNLAAAGVTFTYDDMGVDIAGLSLLTDVNDTFTMTVTGVKDASGNNISTTNGENVVVGRIENSTSSFGNFGGETHMFGPPSVGGGTIGGEFDTAGQIGGFAMGDFFGGSATSVYPFSRMAGQDSNVMQFNFSPGVALLDGDQIVITLPEGTGIYDAAQDTWSPFKEDFNMEWGSGTVTFDNTFDTDGISVTTTQRKITVKLDVVGAPGADDFYTIDLKGITNPAIPKGPETAGYTATLKLLRGGAEQWNETSMPYFIDEAGDNTLTVNVYAGSQVSPDSVSGTVNVFGWGPAGPIDKSLTLANGVISEVNGTVAASVQYTSLPDGCYSVGTEPFITLGSTDYFGQEFAEPVCVDGGESATHNIVLANSSSTASATLTVKLAGISDFNSADIDIFAGGPGRFVVKSLTSLGAPDAAGYTLRLPANGNWFVGVGPGMPKGSSSMSMPKPLPGIPPSPMDVVVRNVDTTPAISQGMQQLGPGVSFNDATDTITFTFAAADKAISGTVKDDSNNALSSVDIGVESQFGGVWSQTAQDGTFTLNVSALGTYEINAFKWGLPSMHASIEVRADGSDAGTAPDIYYKGKLITGSNPLVLKMKKAAYSISGKVLDSGGSAYNWVPVSASDADGNVVFGGSDSTGNYTLFVGAGTWTVTAQPPLSETEECSTYSKTVTITNESKSSQNLEPATTTCYTLTGTVTIAGTAADNVPLMIEEWNTVTDRPAGGVFKPTSTNASGVYTAKVTGNKTYMISTWDMTYGEISDTVAVTTSATTTKNLTSGSAASMTFGFTGLPSADLANLDGFLVLENSTTGEKKVESIDNLSDSSVIQGLGSEFSYDLQIPGVGEFSGTVATGETESIDLSSVATDLVSYSGTVVDDSSVLLSNAVVTFENDATNVVKTVLADEDGEYFVNLPTGNWTISASLANHMPLTRTAVTLSADSASNVLTLEETGSTIEGTVYESNGTTPADSGFVTATSSTGEKITAPIEADGTYSIPVANDTWTVTAGATLHRPTALSETVVISSDTSDTGNNITMTADATRTVSSSVKTISAGSGGTVDDTNNSGVQFTTAGGVINTDNTDVNITIEQTYESGDTTSGRTLGNVGWEMTAADTTETYDDFTGNAKLEINYTDLLSSIPSGASESDLQLVYFSPEHNDYIPVEGGFTIDTVNNTVTANTDHFTTFSLIVPASAATGASAFGGSVSYYPQGERAVVKGEEVAVESGEEGEGLAEESVEECVVEAVEGAPDEASAEAAAGECLPPESEDIADVEEEESYVEVDEDANTVTYFVPPADTYEVSFTDVGKHWSNDIVSDLAGRGIIDGFKVGNQLQFKPDQGMTRAELVKAVVRAMELPVPLEVKGADLGYYDVRSDSEYAPYIYAAQKAGIVDRALLFRPNAVVNRAEALKVILLSAKVDLADFPDGMVLPFADVSRDSWFRNHVKYAFYHGIVGGYAKDGKREFRGVKDVSRAEASKMISEVFDFEEKDGGLGDMLKAALFGLFR